MSEAVFQYEPLAEDGAARRSRLIGIKLRVLVAEELDVDWSEVVVEQLPYGAIPADNALGFDSKYGPQQAGGSTNVK